MVFWRANEAVPNRKLLINSASRVVAMLFRVTLTVRVFCVLSTAVTLAHEQVFRSSSVMRNEQASKSAMVRAVSAMPPSAMLSSASYSASPLRCVSDTLNWLEPAGESKM